jgi:cell division protein FtsB
VFRWLLLLLLLLCVALQIKLWSGQGGRADVHRLQARVEQQKAENAALQQRNEALAADVDDLKTGTDAIEEKARGELGMIKPGETFYQVVEEGPNTERKPE